MNTKRIISLLTTIAITFSLIACNSSSENDNNFTDSNCVTVATGTITGQLCSAYATEEGDSLISYLVSPTIYTYDRGGELLLDSSSGKNIPFNGKEYNYKTIADISSSYDEASNTSTYTIKLGNVNFSDGTIMTADDLIFTYYVLCDESYNGPYSLNKDNSIIGINAYQLNNSAAPNIEISEDSISDALGNPTDELKKTINTEVIKPVIEEGRTFCEENWQLYVDRGYGNSAEELFVLLFPTALQSDYSAEGKTFDQIVQETIDLFGMNYKAIARIYYGEVEHLNGEVNKTVKKFLYEKALEKAGGVEVPSIEGIKKIDEQTVSVRALGKGDKLMQSICDIPVLSLDYYGKASEYSYSNNNFGITRGDVSIVKSHSTEPYGYGPYIIQSFDNGIVTLIPNENYSLGNIPEVNLKFVNIVDAEKVSNIVDKNVDIAYVDLDSEILSAITNANNGSISGDAIKTMLVNDDSYEYFGLNAALLNYGADAGLHVRKGLATLLAAAKKGATTGDVGDFTKLIEYPASSAYFAVPKIGDENFRYAFDVADKDGVYIDEAAAISKAKEEFTAAGYTLGTNGKLTAPAGFKTSFNIAIPSYLLNDRIMMAIFEKVQTQLSSLGLSVEPTYFEQTDEFILALQGKTFDIWMAERSTMNTKFINYYGTNGSSNYYGFSNADIDKLFADIANDINNNIGSSYSEILTKLMDYAIEVPVYQNQQAIIYNQEKISVSSDYNFTEYFTMYQDLSAITQ